MNKISVFFVVVVVNLGTFLLEVDYNIFWKDVFWTESRWYAFWESETSLFAWWQNMNKISVGFFFFLIWDLLFWKSTTALCEKMVLGWKAGGMPSENQKHVCLRPLNHDGESNWVTWIKYQCFWIRDLGFGSWLEYFVKSWFLDRKQFV